MGGQNKRGRVRNGVETGIECGSQTGSNISNISGAINTLSLFLASIGPPGPLRLVSAKLLAQIQVNPFRQR